MLPAPILALALLAYDPPPRQEAPVPPPPTEAPMDPMKDAPKPPPPLPKIDPATPLKDLLPTAPVVKKAPVYLGDDLRRAPELSFEAAPAKALDSPEWLKRKGFAVAAALHLNARDEDGYLKAAIKGRDDLAGLPFLLGGACRMKGLAREAFKQAASGQVARKSPPRKVLPPLTAPPPAAALSGALPSARLISFKAEREEAPAPDKAQEDALERAHVAVLAQVNAIHDMDTRVEVVNTLAGISRPEATRELARLAVYSAEKEVREAALKALSVRRERDYTGVLTEALRYPWPAVARNAARAIVKLEREDLLPKLADMLDAADPRSPREEKGGHVAAELVRINHHKSCLMCHAPARAGEVADDVLAAPMPLPSEKLPPPGEGYNGQGQPSNLLVRIDVTYLRQDFSVMQEVKDADPWPALQRFDFVVRQRGLTKDEAADLKKRLEGREPGVLSPYQRAAVTALREMTGRDFEAKADVWRKFLKSRP